MPALAQHGAGRESGVESHPYHLRALRHDYPCIRIGAIAKLSVGKRGEHCHTAIVEPFDLYLLHSANLQNFSDIPCVSIISVVRAIKSKRLTLTIHIHADTFTK